MFDEYVLDIREDQRRGLGGPETNHICSRFLDPGARVHIFWKMVEGSHFIARRPSHTTATSSVMVGVGAAKLTRNVRARQSGPATASSWKSPEV